MNRKAKIVIALLSLLVIVVLALPLLKRPEPPGSIPGQNPGDQLRAERLKLMPPDQVVKLINPRPGATVVDLGAGFGLFTFELARAVGDGGTVYATDIDPSAVSYLTEQARSTGVRNVVPVRVKAEGVDNFYIGRSFDIILAADVLPFIRQPEDFFGKLRPALAAGAGRLWVIDLRLDPDFSVLELGAAGDISASLSSPAARQILVSRFREEARRSIEDGSVQSERFPETVVAELNRILEDPTLFFDARAGNLTLNSREGKLRQYLARIVEREGGFTDQTISGKPAAKAALRLLNRLVVQDLIGTAVWEKSFSLDNLDWAQWEPLVNRLAAGQDYGELFRKAGYEPVRQHQVLRYHYTWEFRRVN